MADPFDINQYVASFNKSADYNPQVFNFADFETIFAQISEAIRARQASVTIGFNLGNNVFTSVDEYDTSNPNAVADSVVKFQDALREFVDGFIIEEYGKLPDCDVKVGFFIYANGLPITGVDAIAPNGVDFTATPDPSNYPNSIDFARAVVVCINEIVYALNVLRYIHGKMYYAYPADDTCEIVAPPPPPPSCTSADAPNNDSRCSALLLNIINDNDNCPTATFVNGTTVCATVDADDPYPSSNPNVWYKFTTPDYARETSSYYNICNWDSLKYTFAIYQTDGTTIDTDWAIRIYAKSTTGLCTLYTDVFIGGASGTNPASVSFLPCTTYFVEVFRASGAPTATDIFKLDYSTEFKDGNDEIGYPSNPCEIQPPCDSPCADNYGEEGPCNYDDPNSTECLGCWPNICTDPCANNYIRCLPCTYAPPLPPNCDQPSGVCNDSCAKNYGVIGECTYSTVLDPGCDPCLAAGAITGCMTEFGTINYCSSATCSGTCIEAVPGCTNSLCGNYNSLATIDDGSCCGCGPTPGCMNPNCSNYSPCANVNSGCTGCGGEIYGCMYSCCENYDANANVHDPTACGPCTPNSCDGPVAVCNDPCLFCEVPPLDCCFAYGTRILLADNSYKNIEDITQGEIIAAYNVEELQYENSNEVVLRTKLAEPRTSNFVTGTVTRILHGSEKEHYVINKTIKTTFEHPFYVRVGQEYRFVEARNLRVGYFMINKNADLVEITDIEIVKESIETVSLSIDKYCTFIAEDMIVHNEQIFDGSGQYDGDDPNSQLNGGGTAPGTPTSPLPPKNPPPGGGGGEALLPPDGGDSGIGGSTGSL